jgi:hypothetical protein
MGSTTDPIVASFKKLVTEVFGDNMAFGFIFGSAAKGKLKVAGPDKHDLDTFICLKMDDQDAKKEYSRRIAILHNRYGLKVDEEFPTEVMTLGTLQTIISELDSVNVSVDELVTGIKFDHMFWVHALTDEKTGFVGDGIAMSSLIKDGQPHIYRWRDQIIEQLEARETLPEHICKTFSGLGKEDAIAKLSKHSPHLVVHLGLNYDDGSITKLEELQKR